MSARSERRRGPSARDLRRAAPAPGAARFLDVRRDRVALPDGSDGAPRVHRPSRRGDDRAAARRRPARRRAPVALSDAARDARVSGRQARAGRAGARLRDRASWSRRPATAPPSGRAPASCTTPSPIRTKASRSGSRAAWSPASAASTPASSSTSSTPAPTSSTPPPARRAHRRQDADRPALVAELARRPLAARVARRAGAVVTDNASHEGPEPALRPAPRASKAGSRRKRISRPSSERRRRRLPALRRHRGRRACRARRA